MNLDSELLRAFVAVAETGNVTRAAERMGRTQSAVSMQIRKLEDLVGDPLFKRGSRGVSLTRKGEGLIANARRIVALLEETAASLKSAPLDGPVRIGIPEEYGVTILAQALSEFSKQHPRVEITVRFARTSSQVAALNAGELDLAVVFEWEDFSDSEILMADPTVWATSARHLRHEERPLPIAIYPSSGWCRDYALKSLERRGIDYRVAYMSDTSGGLRLAATSGLAVAPISRSNIPAGCRELMVAEGFGAIDAARVVLRRNPGATGAAVIGMAEAISEAFRTRPEG
ncbi:LysR family transcriptional regulator [Mesorhizobium sp. IMUNJ 23232]|uniref:LysR family transcriptional regulator n=1 Tax=Mesorhizobium sp. IMUNJ 23232 TaxID=3376064 RepID=UPI003787D45D